MFSLRVNILNNLSIFKMTSFYVNNINSNDIYLDAEESRHCIKVLRLKNGDQVHVLDGKGSIFNSEIVDANPKKCRLEIVGKEESLPQRNYHLTIAIAPTKNIERFEWFLEKCTEIGIDRIIPLICQHSERKDIKPERLEKIIISAMKQSGQSYLPELTEKISFKTLINSPFYGEKLIAHCVPESKKLLQNSITPGSNMLIMIGPEGDFDPEEIKLALLNSFVPVSLGASRLRTETAGIVACHTACLINSK